MASFLLVDDHSVVLECLKNVITSIGHEVIGEAKSGIEAVKKINTLNPKFIILDIGIPHLDGFEVIKRCPPHTDQNYIIFSSMPHSLIKEHLEKINIKVYISKQDDISNIKTKLESYINSHCDIYVDTSSDANELVNSLSAREILVLKYLAQGYRNKEIANLLILSEKTVSTYKKRLMDKLGCTSMSNLILFVHRNNIL
ncbi:response regulator transcription factor [Vibrio anguillarum]|uniref:response regulator transcription factor n=2 Tax=Vibrio anguillarum TaxID=55601 RepID=UPI0002F3B62C|nr:response regulator transcription factor [Vibrio anguillarum]OEE41661.1 DNA-binding response regulator [Vibrio anguillarum]